MRAPRELGFLGCLTRHLFKDDKLGYSKTPAPREFTGDIHMKL
jgi:hypothetical protein